MAKWHRELQRYMYTIGHMTQIVITAIKNVLIKYDIPINDEFKTTFLHFAKQQYELLSEHFNVSILCGKTFIFRFFFKFW